MLKAYSLKAWVILVLLAIIWGSSFILMDRSMHDGDGSELLSPQAVAALRMTLATLVLLPFAFPVLKLITRKNWLPLLGVGLFGNLLPAFLFTSAQFYIESSYAGMLNCLTPLFVVLIGISAFKLKIRTANAIGLLMGMIGAVSLFVAKGTGMGDDILMGSLLIVCATVGYAMSVNMIRYYLQDLTAIQITALTFSMIFLPSAGYLFATDFIDTLQTNPDAIKAVGYTSVLAILGTSVAIGLFNYLIKISNVLFATSVTYLIPLVAIFWGYLNEESFSAIQLISIPVILGGVYLVNRPIK